MAYGDIATYEGSINVSGGGDLLAETGFYSLAEGDGASFNGNITVSFLGTMISDYFMMYLAIGDGALGFWHALREVFGATKEQRCWFHKTGNVLNAMPNGRRGGCSFL